MNNLWGKITHRNSIAVWIIPILGLLILGAVISFQFFGYSLYQQASQGDVSAERVSSNQESPNSGPYDRLVDEIVTAGITGELQEDLPDLTQEEVYKDSYIKHIRSAIDAYSNQTFIGIETEAVEGFPADESMQCGLDNFNKEYYKSKFIVYSTEPGKYGGRVASIVFIDRPDTLFFTWVFNLEEGYFLRAFCKEGPPIEKQSDFEKLMKGMIKDGFFKYPL